MQHSLVSTIFVHTSIHRAHTSTHRAHTSIHRAHCDKTATVRPLWQTQNKSYVYTKINTVINMYNVMNNLISSQSPEILLNTWMISPSSCTVGKYIVTEVPPGDLKVQHHTCVVWEFANLLAAQHKHLLH
ncbi:hypothetical protein NP493_1755g00005 [Ridgeia piscesae]|uniref:Uncharacterized protein n=1 Tax=Ridgeia piscesae TaxID=27915 RepID=A0AAD9JTD7_RIDPI|nr:hypothetical protein NP493_1755g00005 [Ridgeia piscesae]